MENIRQLIASAQEGIRTVIGYAGLLIALILLWLLVSSLFRFLFGKQGQLAKIFTATVQMIFLYALTVAASRLALDVGTPLPFLCQGDNGLTLFIEADFPGLCAQILRLLIITLAVQLIGSITPEKKGAVRLFLCLASVVAAFGLNLLLDGAFAVGIWQYAPVILLGALALLILLGSLRLIVGIILGIVNPAAGVAYTFFVSNFLGRALSRAIVTTAILASLAAVLTSLA